MPFRDVHLQSTPVTNDPFPTTQDSISKASFLRIYTFNRTGNSFSVIENEVKTIVFLLSFCQSLRQRACQCHKVLPGNRSF
jgi:hypothetical protein